MKKIFALILSLVLALTIIPSVALADDECAHKGNPVAIWTGEIATDWYNETDTEFTLDTAEDLAGLAKLVDEGNSFAGKTVKLGANIDLNNKLFDPIGSYRNDKAFKGTFNGQNYTISNLSQDTWSLNNGYYYGDLGLGLFGLVEDAIVKNLNIDGASISGESALCGTIAATAYGDTIFENISVTNSNVADYQYYAGGIVGWASGNHQYINCNVDASTTVGSQWGDFGNCNGGIIGGIGSSGSYHFKDCTVACRIDATNDIVSAYQWWNYRNSGMLIGRVPQQATNGEVQTVATPTNVTCENVSVIYGDWANYTYCEFAGTGYPYVRVQAGTSVDAYSNVRYGHPTDADGNTVVDDNHKHNDGEDHHILIKFDQLFGGPADHRYCYYGIKEFGGVELTYNNEVATKYNYEVSDSTGTKKNSSVEGETITITAAEDSCCQFKEWVVLAGDVTLADATKISTKFTMPKGYVKVVAVYQDNIAYDVVVINGTDNSDKTATKEEVVTITAETKDNMVFTGWEVVKGNITLSDSKSETTTFTMPKEAVEVKALYEELKITEGAGSKYNVEKTEVLTFKSNGQLNKLLNVKVDGEVVDAKNYDVKAGSTIVTFKESYADSLKAGTHKLTMEYVNGNVTCEFTVIVPEKLKAPETGDTTNVLGLLTMLLGSAFIISRKRTC